MHTFELNNFNLFRINLIEEPQAKQVSSDLGSSRLALCCKFVRTRQHRGLFYIRRPRGRHSVPNDKL